MPVQGHPGCGYIGVRRIITLCRFRGLLARQHPFVRGYGLMARRHVLRALCKVDQSIISLVINASALNPGVCGSIRPEKVPLSPSPVH